MKLGLEFYITIEGVSAFPANGGDSVTNEMKDLASEYKKKLERDGLDKLAFVERQRLLTTLGPKRWTELRTLIKQKLDEFNTEMETEAVSWDDPHSSRIAITRKNDGVKLEGGYEGGTSTLFLRSKPLKIDMVFTQSVQGDDVVFVFTNPETKHPSVNTAEEIASGLLRDFLSR
jgi:hypothetical protein